MRTWICLALLLALWCPGASAEARVDGLAVFEALKRVGPEPWSREQARAVVEAIFQDGTMSEAEMEIVKLLGSSAGRSFSVEPQTGSTELPLTIQGPEGDVSDMFRVLAEVAAGSNLNEYWLVEGRMHDFYLLASTAEPVRRRLQSFVSSKLLQAWKSSNLDNGYREISGVITRCYSYVPKREDDLDLHQRSRTLLFKAARAVDRHVNDEIPGFLYEWLEEESL